MGKRFVFAGGRVDAYPFSTIFGSNYREDWNADLGLSNTGGLVDSWTSQGLDGSVLTSSGALRPSVTTSGNFSGNVINFDGISEYMTVPSSTGQFNYLHNTNGCTVIFVVEPLSTPGTLGVILNTQFGASGAGFRFQRNSYRSFAVLTRNSSSDSIYYDISSSFSVQNNNKSYGVVIIDPTNVTLADRGTLVVNGTDYNGNVDTGTADNTNANNDLTVGVRAILGNFYFNGNIKRMILADVTADATMKTKIINRLIYEYGNF